MVLRLNVRVCCLQSNRHITTAPLKLINRHIDNQLLGAGVKFDEAVVTVWLVVAFFKRSLVELLQTERTDEVLGVELLVHGRNAATCKPFKKRYEYRKCYERVCCEWCDTRGHCIGSNNSPVIGFWHPAQSEPRLVW